MFIIIRIVSDNKEMFEDQYIPEFKNISTQIQVLHEFEIYYNPGERYFKYRGYSQPLLITFDFHEENPGLTPSWWAFKTSKEVYDYVRIRCL